MKKSISFGILPQKTILRFFLTIVFTVAATFPVVFAQHAESSAAFAEIDSVTKSSTIVSQEISVPIRETTLAEIELEIAQIVKSEVEKLNLQDIEMIKVLQDVEPSSLAKLATLSDKELQKELTNDAALAKALEKLDSMEGREKMLGIRAIIRWFLSIIPKILKGVKLGVTRGIITGVTSGDDVSALVEAVDQGVTTGCRAGLGHAGSIFGFCGKLGDFFGNVVEALEN